MNFFAIVEKEIKAQISVETVQLGDQLGNSGFCNYGQP